MRFDGGAGSHVIDSNDLAAVGESASNQIDMASEFVTVSGKCRI